MFLIFCRIPIVENNLEDGIEESIEIDIDEQIKLPNKGKKKVKVMTEAAKLLVAQKKKEMMAKTLAAYIETCVHQNMTKRAEFALKFLQHRTNASFKFTLDDINVYNALMKSYATRGHLKEIVDMLQKMEKDKIIPDLKTYTIMLLGFGKNSSKDVRYKKKLQNYIKEAESRGFDFNRIMNEGVFLKDEREVVLKAMKVFNPEFQPQYLPPLVQYNNDLVNNLNHPDQLQPPKKEENNKGPFKVSDLKELVMEQLKQELEISVTVCIL